MKTSNKILFAAIALSVLTTAGALIFFHTKYNRTKAYPQELLQQLATTKIRTLMVEKSNVTISSNLYFYPQYSRELGLIQYVAFNTVPTPEIAVIQGDTLRVRNQFNFLVQLPDLENYIVDGVPQPVPNK